MTKPTYISEFLPRCNAAKLFDVVNDTTNWTNVGAPRDECFMAYETTKYSYRRGVNYESVTFSYIVEAIMTKLNWLTKSNYDICFLNKYEDETKFLGWHSDDSFNMDETHPIASVSLGGERQIWVKEIGYKGDIPEEDRFLLEDGSAFIMPPYYQNTHLHRIPKGDRPCKPRISMTFRKYKEK